MPVKKSTPKRHDLNDYNDHMDDKITDSSLEHLHWKQAGVGGLSFFESTKSLSLANFDAMMNPFYCLNERRAT